MAESEYICEHCGFEFSGPLLYEAHEALCGE